MITIQAHVAAVTPIDGQPLATVTFEPLQSNHDGEHHPDHTWAGDGAHIGLTMAVNMSREAAEQYERGAAVTITVEATADRE